MNKMIILVVLLAISTIVLGTTTVMAEDNRGIILKEKIVFLEKELAQKNQEYVWLKELQDYCLETGELPDMELTPPFKKT